MNRPHLLKALAAWRWPVLLVLLSCGIGVGSLYFRSPVPAIVVMPQPYHPPPRKGPWPDRWIPARPSWAWAWHLKELVLGRPKPINLEATVIDLTGATESSLGELALGQPDLIEAGGLSIWRLDDVRLKGLRARIKALGSVVSSPRCSTADKIECSMFVGETIVLRGVTNQVGLEAEFYPRLLSRSTDLTASFTLSEMVTNHTADFLEPGTNGTVRIRTNLAVAARFQVPAGQGVFLLDAVPGAAKSRRMGVILSANRPKPK